MNPFSSDKFLSDAYFSETVTIAGTSVPAVVTESEAVATAGTFSSKTGTWKQVSIKENVLVTAPAAGDEVVIKGKTYKIQPFPRQDGDMIVFNVFADQRFKK